MPETVATFKTIRIVKAGPVHNGHPAYDVLCIEDDSKMGELTWDPTWGRYIFAPDRMIILFAEDLRDIAGFMEGLK